MLTTYTSYNEVRATLGVSSLELDDDTLALPIYYDNLVLDFADVSEQLQAKVDEVAAKLPADRSALEEKFYKLSRMFACYSVSKHCLTSLSAIALKRTTDGKAEGERFPFAEAVAEGIRHNASLKVILRVLNKLAFFQV